MKHGESKLTQKKEPTRIKDEVATTPSLTRSDTVSSEKITAAAFWAVAARGVVGEFVGSPAAFSRSLPAVAIDGVFSS